MVALLAARQSTRKSGDRAMSDFTIPPRLTLPTKTPISDEPTEKMQGGYTMKNVNWGYIILIALAVFFVGAWIGYAVRASSDDFNSSNSYCVMRFLKKDAPTTFAEKGVLEYHVVCSGSQPPPASPGAKKKPARTPTVAPTQTGTPIVTPTGTPKG